MEGSQYQRALCKKLKRKLINSEKNKLEQKLCYRKIELVNVMSTAGHHDFSHRSNEHSATTQTRHDSSCRFKHLIFCSLSLFCLAESISKIVGFEIKASMNKVF